MRKLLSLFYFDVNSLLELGLEVIYGEIVCLENGVIRHDTNKVAKILYSLLIDETKQRHQAYNSKSF